MKPIGLAFLLGGCLWVIGTDAVEAEASRRSGHHQRSHSYESHDARLSNPSRKEVSFEVLRMLSTGMTRAEVLSRAGSPRYRFGHRWIYSGADSWTVELAFGGDRVAEVNWSRSRP
jgi:hypothetical protein